MDPRRQTQKMLLQLLRACHFSLSQRPSPSISADDAEGLAYSSDLNGDIIADTNSLTRQKACLNATAGVSSAMSIP